jgi:hypothetical protein
MTEIKFHVGDKVVDRDEFKGTITKITVWEGSVWYDVKFPGGDAVRYTGDLRKIHS